MDLCDRLVPGTDFGLTSEQAAPSLAPSNYPFHSYADTAFVQLQVTFPTGSERFYTIKLSQFVTENALWCS